MLFAVAALTSCSDNRESLEVFKYDFMMTDGSHGTPQVWLHEDGTATLEDFPLGDYFEQGFKWPCTKDPQWFTGDATWRMPTRGSLIIDAGDVSTEIRATGSNLGGWDWGRPYQVLCNGRNVYYYVLSEYAKDYR